jgi:uncharacterized membrane-anchored protein YhcB (DUF1043 family)
MIERNDFMADKKFTTEELTKQVEDAKKTFDCLNEQLQKQKKEEAERKQSELAAQKEIRQKEVEEAFEEYQNLMKAFIKDYGSISIHTSSDAWAPFFADKPWHWWF